MDDNLLKYNYDDNQRVEPEWYIPIIPTVLVNGADGIGTGWASKIPNYDIREIVNNIHRLLNGEEPQPMVQTYISLLVVLCILMWTNMVIKTSTFLSFVIASKLQRFSRNN